MRGIRARAAAGLRGAGRADADGGEPAPVNCAKNAPLRAWNIRGVIPRPSALRPVCPQKSPFPAGLADAPRPPRTFPRRAAATAAENAAIRPVHFSPLTRRNTMKKLPCLGRENGPCAAAGAGRARGAGAHSAPHSPEPAERRRAGGKSLSPRPRAGLNPEGRGRDIPLSGRTIGGGMWRARRGNPRGRREAGRREHPDRGGRFRARGCCQTMPRIGRVVFSPHKHMAI